MVGKFSDRLHAIEIGSYFLVVVPFLTDYIETGAFPTTPRGYVTEICVSAIILAFCAILHRTIRELHELERMKRELTLATIHDLKNPLSAIISSLDAVVSGGLDSCREEGDMRTLVDIAIRNASKELHMVEMLQDIDRIEAAVLSPKITEIDVKALLNQAIEDDKSVAMSHGINVVMDIPAPIAPLHADFDLVRRIVGNLLSNALKYTTSGGSVTLYARPENGGVYFEVRDTGKGIPKSAMGRMFSKFFRVEGTDQSARKGAGIGLYFCRLAVEAHGGSIGVNSEEEHGSVFHFFIPDKKQ